MNIGLKQKKGSVNCYAVVVAMLLELSIEEVETKLLPNVAPFSDIEIYKLLLNYGYVLGGGGIMLDPNIKYSDNYFFGYSFRLQNQKAFIIVKSQTLPEPNTHVIFWDGEKIFDPNPDVIDGVLLEDYNIIEIYLLNNIGKAVKG